MPGKGVGMRSLLLILGAAVLAALIIRGVFAAFRDLKKEVKDDSNA